VAFAVRRVEVRKLVQHETLAAKVEYWTDVRGQSAERAVEALAVLLPQQVQA
jgi:hypothetical protein